jgi:hypothetical protein
MELTTIDRKLNDELLLTLQGLIANWENGIIKQADGNQRTSQWVLVE